MVTSGGGKISYSPGSKVSQDKTVAVSGWGGKVKTHFGDIWSEWLISVPKIIVSNNAWSSYSWRRWHVFLRHCVVCVFGVNLWSSPQQTSLLTLLQGAAIAMRDAAARTIAMSIFAESFMTIAATISRNVANRQTLWQTQVTEKRHLTSCCLVT